MCWLLRGHALLLRGHALLLPGHALLLRGHALLLCDHALLLHDHALVIAWARTDHCAWARIIIAWARIIIARARINHFNLFYSWPFRASMGHRRKGALLIKYGPIIMVGLWCYNQSGMTELFIMRDPHYVLSQFKHSDFYILSCEKGLGLRTSHFSQLRM